MAEKRLWWKNFKALIATPDLPELGPNSRASRLSLDELNRRVERFSVEANLPSALHATIRSAALLWHDYLDESHTISQNIRNVDGSFLHGIMHRREPDYSNAKYWFHRVGEHACFPRIAKGARRLLETKGENELAANLAPRGDWNAFGFVDACEEAAELPSAHPRIQALKAIQEIEFDCLLGHLVARW